MTKLKSTVAVGCFLLISTGLSGGAEACGMPSDVVLAQVVLNVVYPEALHVTGATWGLQKSGKIDMPDKERMTATGERLDELIYEAHLADLDALELLGASFHAESQQAHAISLVLIDGMHWARFLPDPLQAYDPSNFNCNTANRTVGDLVVITAKPILHSIRKRKISIGRAIGQGAMRLYGDDQQVNAFLSDFGLIGEADLINVPSDGSLIQRLAKAAAIEKLLSPTFQPETQ